MKAVIRQFNDGTHPEISLIPETENETEQLSKLSKDRAYPLYGTYHYPEKLNVVFLRRPKQ